MSILDGLYVCVTIFVLCFFVVVAALILPYLVPFLAPLNIFPTLLGAAHVHYYKHMYFGSGGNSQYVELAVLVVVVRLMSGHQFAFGCKYNYHNVVVVVELLMCQLQNYFFGMFVVVDLIDCEDMGVLVDCLDVLVIVSIEDLLVATVAVVVNADVVANDYVVTDYVMVSLVVFVDQPVFEHLVVVECFCLPRTMLFV